VSLSSKTSFGKLFEALPISGAVSSNAPSGSTPRGLEPLLLLTKAAESSHPFAMIVENTKAWMRI
jgi:hypothetical protein